MVLACGISPRTDASSSSGIGCTIGRQEAIFVAGPLSPGTTKRKHLNTLRSNTRSAAAVQAAARPRVSGLTRADLGGLARDSHEWPMAGPRLNRTRMDS